MMRIFAYSSHDGSTLGRPGRAGLSPARGGRVIPYEYWNFTATRAIFSRYLIMHAADGLCRKCTAVMLTKNAFFFQLASPLSMPLQSVSAR